MQQFGPREDNVDIKHLLSNWTTSKRVDVRGVGEYDVEYTLRNDQDKRE
jgi:hypothetical protein